MKHWHSCSAPKGMSNPIKFFESIADGNHREHTLGELLENARDLAETLSNSDNIPSRQDGSEKITMSEDCEIIEEAKNHCH